MCFSFEVLGAAGAAPLGGACSSGLVRGGGATVLLDCGPGVLERLWARDLLGDLDAIVLTHAHADHVLDLVPLAGEVVQAQLHGRRIALHLPRGVGRVLDALDAALAREPRAVTRFARAFDVTEHDAGDVVAVGGLELRFAPTAHPQPCFALRATDGASVLVHGADGAPSAQLDALAAGADLLVLEATLADDAATAAAHGHMTAVQAGETAARAGAGALLLTHLLPGAGDEHLALAARAYDGPVALAREGDVHPVRA
jgi:ribonuclease BN (tRNA processing enzyme)